MFLSEHFEHLFENDLLKKIHDKIPKNPEDQGDLYANSMNAINEKADSKFKFKLFTQNKIIFI